MRSRSRVASGASVAPPPGTAVVAGPGDSGSPTTNTPPTARAQATAGDREPDEAVTRACGAGGAPAGGVGGGRVGQECPPQQQFAVGVQAGDRRRGQQGGQAEAFVLLGQVVRGVRRGGVHPWVSWLDGRTAEARPGTGVSGVGRAVGWGAPPSAGKVPLPGSAGGRAASGRPPRPVRERVARASAPHEFTQPGTGAGEAGSDGADRHAERLGRGRVVQALPDHEGEDLPVPAPQSGEGGVRRAQLLGIREVGHEVVGEVRDGVAFRDAGEGDVTAPHVCVRCGA